MYSRKSTTLSPSKLKKTQQQYAIETKTLWEGEENENNKNVSNYVFDLSAGALPFSFGGQS